MPPPHRIGACIWTLAAALALGGCLAPPSPEAFLEQTRDDFAAAASADGEVVKRNAETLFELATELDDGAAPDCAAPQWQAAAAAAERIERKAFTRYVLAQDSNGLVALFRDVNLEMGETFARRAVEGRILLANAAVRHGCKAIASQHYRHIVKTYRTEAFERYHMLAKSGLSELWSAAAM